MNLSYLYIALLSLLFIQCSSQNCGSELNPYTEIGFFELSSKNTENEIAVSIDKFSISSLNRGETDSTIIINNKNIFSLDLPLNTNLDSSKYLIKVDTIFDTLTVFYERSIKSRSTDCEFTMNFKLQDIEYSKNKLKDVSIENAIIEELDNTSTDETTDPTYHINFYF